MAKTQRKEFARKQRGALDADAAEELFTKVDETGHPNEERAAAERARRAGGAEAVDIDPLSGNDPSGSNVEKVITRTAVTFMLEFLGDSILGAIIATELFERYPDMDEGQLTRLKISLVSGHTLSIVSDALGLSPLIVMGIS